MTSTESSAPLFTTFSRLLQRGFLIRLFILAVLLGGCGLYSLYLGSDQSLDYLNYHLYAPFALLNSRLGFDIQPAQAQTYLNPLLDLPFYLLIEHLNNHPKLIGFVQGTVNGISLFCVVSLAWRVLGRVTGESAWTRILLSATALVIGATGADARGLIGTTSGDIQVAALILCALVLAMRALEASSLERGVLSAALASGLCAGIASGLKPTMCAFGLGLFALLLVLHRPWRFKGELCFLLSAASGFIIAAGPHAMTMEHVFGSPTFPMFNGVFQSPYFDNHGNGVLRGSFFGTLMFESFATPLSLLIPAIKRPFLSLVEIDTVANGPYRDPRLAIAILLPVFAFASWPIRRLKGSGSEIRREIFGLWLCLVVASFASLLVFTNYRYLAPVESISAILIVLTTRELAGPRLGILGAIVIAAFCVTVTVPNALPHTRWGDRYISIKGPNLSPDTLVIIASDRGSASFLIPFFDPRIRWLRTRSNLIPPNGTGPLVDEVKALIAEQTGPMVSVEITSEALAARDPILRELHLERTGEPCSPIETNATALPYAFCPIRKSLPAIKE